MFGAVEERKTRRLRRFVSAYTAAFRTRDGRPAVGGGALQCKQPCDFFSLLPQRKSRVDPPQLLVEVPSHDTVAHVFALLSKTMRLEEKKKKKNKADQLDLIPKQRLQCEKMTFSLFIMH